MSHLSIIIPTLNEEKLIERTILTVKAAAPEAEIIVVDGNSNDSTVVLARQHVCVIHAQRGRGAQLNAGVAATQGEIMLFLHAATLPDKAGLAELMAVMQNEKVLGGAFRMRFDISRPIFQHITANPSCTLRLVMVRSMLVDA